MKKITLLAAVGVGYVLGTRAGRGRYEQIKQQAEKVWSNDSVQATVDKAQDTAKHTASDVGHRVAETAKDVSGVVSEKARSAAHLSKEKVSAGSDSDSETHIGAPDSSATPMNPTDPPAAGAPGYSSSSEGLRAGAKAADASGSFDIDEAGSDDLAAAPNPVTDDRPGDARS